MPAVRQFFKPGTTVLIAGFGRSVTVGQLLTNYAQGSLHIIPDLLAAGTLFGGDIAKGGQIFPGIVTADGHDSFGIAPGDEIIGIGRFPDQIDYVRVTLSGDTADIGLLLLLKCEPEKFRLHDRPGRRANPGRDFRRLLNIDQDVRAIISRRFMAPESYHEKLKF